jgi:hypothetical protein
MDLDRWKRFKKSGAYKRKVIKTYQEMLTPLNTDLLNAAGKDRVVKTGESSGKDRAFITGEGSGQNNCTFIFDENESDYEKCASEKSLSEFENDNDEELSDFRFVWRIELTADS